MSKKLFLLQKEILIFNRISTSHVKINPSLIPKYISKSIKIPKEKKILPYKNPVPNWAKTPEFSFFFHSTCSIFTGYITYMFGRVWSVKIQEEEEKTQENFLFSSNKMKFIYFSTNFLLFFHSFGLFFIQIKNFLFSKVIVNEIMNVENFPSFSFLFCPWNCFSVCLLYRGMFALFISFARK